MIVADKLTASCNCGSATCNCGSDTVNNQENRYDRLTDSMDKLAASCNCGSATCNCGSYTVNNQGDGYDRLTDSYVRSGCKCGNKGDFLFAIRILRLVEGNPAYRQAPTTTERFLFGFLSSVADAFAWLQYPHSTHSNGVMFSLGRPTAAKKYLQRWKRQYFILGYNYIYSTFSKAICSNIKANIISISKNLPCICFKYPHISIVSRSILTFNKSKP